MHDDAGRLVSSRPEPEWDDIEVGWMLALEKWRTDALCPLCGMPKEICHAPYGTYVYDVETPVRCQIKTAIRSAQSAHTGDTESLIFNPRVRPWGSVGSG